ncbi:MAG: thiamine pyrophosphate-dependent enzyme [Candidatus Dojkabacteria bacterium]
MEINIEKYNSKYTPTWCPGCGNFGIHMSLKKALSELGISETKTFISFDIGCNGNGADMINTYAFKGLHGRSIPLAVGAHLANRSFTVIADIGDGGCFHEGLDHLVHAIRSNYDITILIHNNQNFALTTGQATVSTKQGKPTYGFPFGKPERDLNITQFILSLSPTYYAKGYSGNPGQLTTLIKEAIKHKGCSVVEIAQLCPTYNKEVTHEWFMENSIDLTTIKEYDKSSLSAVREFFNKADNDKIYTGILCHQKDIKTYYERLECRKNFKTELVEEVKPYNIKNLLKYLE